MRYSEFVFESYRYDPGHSSLSLRYRFADGPRFEEQLLFDFPSTPLSPVAAVVLDRVCRLIFLVSGVSYYKAFVPPRLACEAFPLDRQSAAFLQSFYENGLAEFAWKNRISLQGRCEFQAERVAPPAPIALELPRRTCVPVGGGKDSIVTLECLSASGEDLVLFSLGDAQPIAACIAAARRPFIRVHRCLDPSLLALNDSGALNGHVPITGILSAIVLACAVLYGFDTIAMSNEHSASAPNLMVGGMAVNHQYSKSLEFERNFADYVANHISPDIAYFSLLRPLPEIEIARRFSRHRQYFNSFRSCNTAFRQSPSERSRQWCCDCPKCRFVFLALAPFVAKAELVGIFGRDILDDASQCDGFAALCGLREHKPFECVGEIDESAAVMAHLGRHPDWWNNSVVTRLHAICPSLQRADPGDYLTLLTVRHRHRVPDRFMAMLNACG